MWEISCPNADDFFIAIDEIDLKRYTANEKCWCGLRYEVIQLKAVADE